MHDFFLLALQFKDDSRMQDYNKASLFKFTSELGYILQVSKCQSSNHKIHNVTKLLTNVLNYKGISSSSSLHQAFQVTLHQFSLLSNLLVHVTKKRREKC